MPSQIQLVRYFWLVHPILSGDTPIRNNHLVLRLIHAIQRKLHNRFYLVDNKILYHLSHNLSHLQIFESIHGSTDPRKFLSEMDLSSRIFEKFVSKIYSKQLFIENIDLKYWRRIENFAKTCDFWEFPEREFLSEINLRWNERVDLRKNLRSELKIRWTENNRNIQGQSLAAACTDILRPQMIVQLPTVIIYR